MSINWEESKSVVYDVINKAEKKTEHFIEIQRVRLKISKIKSELNDFYILLGKYFYEESDLDQDVVDDYKKKIKILNVKLNKLNAKLSNLISYKVCNNCGYKNNNDANYCSGCSEKLQ